MIIFSGGCANTYSAPRLISTIDIPMVQRHDPPAYVEGVTTIGDMVYHCATTQVEMDRIDRSLDLYRELIKEGQ